MSDSKDLAVIEESVAMLNNLKLAIKTEADLEKFVYASEKLSKMAEMIDSNIRKAVSEMMYENDLKTFDRGRVHIKHIDPTETEIFYPRSVIEALGMDVAIAFIQIKNGQLKKYLAKAFRVGAITADQLTLAQSKKIKNMKKGYIRIDVDL